MIIRCTEKVNRCTGELFFTAPGMVNHTTEIISEVSEIENHTTEIIFEVSEIEKHTTKIIFKVSETENHTTEIISTVSEIENHTTEIISTVSEIETAILGQMHSLTNYYRLHLYLNLRFKPVKVENLTSVTLHSSLPHLSLSYAI